MKFAKFLRTPILKNICELLLLQFLSHGSMSIIYIYVIDLPRNINMQRRGSYFCKNQKQKPLEIEKKKFFFHLTHFRNPIFSYLRFFRKCSMLRKSIPLKMCWKVLWFFANSRDFNQCRDFMNYVYHDKVDSQHFCLLTNQLFYKIFSHIYKKLLRFIR